MIKKLLFRRSLAFSTMALLMLLPGLGWGQTPTNGGFENGTTTWTTTGTVGATNARTGIKALVSASSTSTSNTAHTNSTSINIPNTNYAHVIAWALGSNSYSNASCGGTLNATASSAATSNIGTTLTRLTYNVINSTGSVATFTSRVSSRTSTTANATQVYFDDVIMYSDALAAADLTKPVVPTSFTNGTITSSSVGFSWTNGSDAGSGIQNTIILRTTNLSAATPVMNDQGVYSTTGGASGPNTVTTDWSVISTTVGASTLTYTDATVSASTSYKYAVIHRDLAYNYSTALLSGTITTLSSGALTPPSLSATTSPTSVDNNFNVTYPTDAAYQTALGTGTIAIGAVTLTSGTDYSLSGNNTITFTPSISGNSSLRTPGTYTISFNATGYDAATISQQLTVGAPAKLSIKTQPAAPAVNGAVLATQPAVYIQDQFGNTTASTASVLAAVGAGTWTLGGTASIAGIAGTVTYSGLTATSTAAVTGATIAFTSAGLTGITSGTFNLPTPPAQIDWANLQYPVTGTITLGDNFDVYAQVYEPGVTDAGSPGPGITAWIGYSTSNTDPSTWTNWVAATFNTDAGNNDEYKANIGAALTSSGTIYYASRFQLGAAIYVYGGYNGGFWNGTTNVSGTLTVNPPNQIDWANLQSPATGTITLGGAFNAYAQVYEPGVTNVGSPGAGITSWIGYSTTNSNPNTWTNWVAATFNTDAGNNDEYIANIGAAIGSVGTYYYASRFKLGLATYVYGGYNGGFWDGSTNVSGVLTVNAFPVAAAVVTLRPSYIDLASATSESAVLMTLSNYSSNDARFRLYNGSNQYNCWNEVVDAYISSNSFASGPQVPGTPTTSSTFWIVFQDGSNSSATATYRDRLGSAYTATYQTIVLPAAATITSPFTISGGFAGNISYSNNVKHVVLAYSGATLISAAATTLNNGLFVIVCPVGTTIDKIEIRAINNTLIETLTGSWATTTNVGYFPDVTTTFSGTGNWSSAGNWSQGIPTYSKKAIIDGTVIIDGAAEAYTLNINSGSSVTINPDFSLTVFSTFTNNAGAPNLVVKSGGSLMESNGVAATVERNITTDIYHGFSPSVAGVTADLFHLLGSTGLDVYLYGHVESNNASADAGYYGITSITTPLVPMTGYSVYALGSVATPPVTSWTFIEHGSLNTGTYGSASNMTRTGAGDNTTFAGFNYIGNPYASFINWNTGTWTKTNMEASVYTENGGVWASYTSPGPGVNGGSNILAPGQGFFVRVINGQTSGTIIMNNTVRTQTSTPYLKSSPVNYVRLVAAGNDKSDETVIRFDTDATSNYDGQYDAVKLGADDAAIPQIYSVADCKLAYNALPAAGLVQLGFTTGVSGVYSIGINAIDGISEITLEDTRTGIFTDLIKGAYTFNAAPGDAEARFLLHFGSLAVNETKNAVSGIYASHGVVYIDLKDNENGDIYVYNVTGQLVAKAKASKGNNKISLANTGNYIVKVITDKTTLVKKIFVQ